MAGAAIVTLATGGALVAVAGPASATTPTGGCWVYTPTTPANIEDTLPASQTSSTLAPWANPGPADYVLTSSGSAAVGGTRNFSLTFNEGPTNGGPPASGVVYYYFSVNGTNLPAISKPFSAGGSAPIPGDTITGSYAIASAGTQTIKLRKVYYDIPTFSTRVACNGQSTGIKVAPSGGVNPATTPLDTNISTSFTATGPTATISSVTNQVVNGYARKGDTINFNVSNFTSGGTAAVELCNTAGSSCDATPGSVTVAGDGTGSGSLTVISNPGTGDRALKVTLGGDVSLTPIKVLAAPTFTTNISGGGASTIVTFDGDNWDPNQTVTVGGYKPPPPIPPGPTGDATIDVTADGTGHIHGTFTVVDPTTAFVGGSRLHSASPVVSVFASAPFTFSGDTCNAKVGSATTGSCSLVQTMNLDITAGNLTASKASGTILMPGFTLDGTAHSVTGALRQVTVKDYRGGALGWSLTGKFSGLTGPATITPDKLSWTPNCAPSATNNDDTVTTGSAGAFTNSTTALPVCSVATTALGADGASGGDTLVDAALSLSVGANQKAGSYVGTITLTLS
ncbi:hypothetical protein GON03_04695 [Nocardioides sp. MAH-18]|uniref:WxL domain-containing protein n=1 Tax=Nocardioides agri TaxID=2682843 RepID=A0A6L6XNZ4_9ACTN|nr:MULTISPECIES: hypothetical protein [unclassified Nocardioides]MBA2953602.1 hypothetical protein [Nocardioides sp. CGMCC 1.13656]MVQ48467.1 hypothetical protein [Nocardioides sp. MAH-18]